MPRMMGLAAALLLSACGGMAEKQMRVSGGPLEPCKGPHCVSSQESRAEFRVEPLLFSGTAADSQNRLASLIQSMERCSVISQNSDYLHAECRSKLMSYVDDLELLWSGGQRIDLRSSSRVGYYDFGVNRERVEDLRSAYSR